MSTQGEHYETVYYFTGHYDRTRESRFCFAPRNLDKLWDHVEAILQTPGYKVVVWHVARRRKRMFFRGPWCRRKVWEGVSGDPTPRQERVRT